MRQGRALPTRGARENSRLGRHVCAAALTDETESSKFFKSTNFSQGASTVLDRT
jgi:hypothetical protein